MKNISKYSNYFREHYQMTYSARDIDLYRQWFASQWNFIKKHIGFMRCHSILEIGAGLGGFYSFLPHGIEYYGLELDSSAVTFANMHFKKRILHNISIESYRTKQKYDFVCAFEVLEHLDNPLKTIHHIHSLLKNGGEFVGTSPYPYPKNVWADLTHKYVLHPENWKKLFEEAGFRSVT